MNSYTITDIIASQPQTCRLRPFWSKLSNVGTTSNARRAFRYGEGEPDFYGPLLVTAKVVSLLTSCHSPSKRKARQPMNCQHG